VKGRNGKFFGARNAEEAILRVLRERMGWVEEELIFETSGVYVRIVGLMGKE
jgi:hypothetical protein